MELFAIAFRNVERNRRRSMLNIIALVIGLTMLISASGLMRGLSSSAYSNMMAMDTAQVQIENRSYRADARRLPLDYDIGNPAPLVERVAMIPGVAAVSTRIDAAFELTNGREGVRVSARAVDAAEARVTDVATRLVAGTYFKPGEPGLIVGKDLAEKLGLSVGDQAFFTGLDKHSVRNLGSATITGIFSFGYPILDGSLVYIDMAQAQGFLDMPDAVTRLVVKGEYPEDSATLTSRIAAELADRSDLVVYEWKTFAETLVSSIESRLAILRFMITILFVLIAIGILNTMSMSVQERFREIGTLRAVGMRSRKLMAMFLIEGSWLGIGGILISCIPAGLIALALGVGGIDMASALPKDVPIPFGSRLYSSYALGDVLAAWLVALLAAILGSILPARRAAKLPITQCLGNTL